MTTPRHHRLLTSCHKRPHSRHTDNSKMATSADQSILSSSYNLKDIAECSKIRCEIYAPSESLGDRNLDDKAYVSRDSRIPCQLLPPFIMNKHRHPLYISNPKYQCYLNSNYLFRFLEQWVILSNLIPAWKVLSNCLFDHSASNSKTWIPSDFDLCIMVLSTMGKFNNIVQIVQNVS